MMRSRDTRGTGLALILALIVAVALTGCASTGLIPQRATQAPVDLGEPTFSIPSPTTPAAQRTVGPGTAIACGPPAVPSPPMTEGPYFKASSPERRSLLDAGTLGERLVLSGYVLTTECEPVPNVKLDFWQTDGAGVYDNAGYALRGHQYTDAAGRYELTTVLPGQYPGRTEHIHVKVEPPGGPVLTTQLFLPESQGNLTDRIFDERLLITLRSSESGWLGSFDFVLAGQ